MGSRQKISVNDANEKSNNSVSSKVDEKKGAVKENVKDWFLKKKFRGFFPVISDL